jgi:hypothetical protein
MSPGGGEGGLQKFEEFDYSVYNRTIFPGLENDMANNYVNPLVQCLFYTPPLCRALLTHVPSVDNEYSLLDEMALLARMLREARGHPCQAKNFIR